MGQKLTKAQRELLAEAARPDRRTPGSHYPGGCSCVPQYRPAQKLVALGLARWRDDNPETNHLLVTDAGRAALSTAEGRP
jgi:hypothetical protein